MGCYVFTKTVAYARNHGMTAAVPFESDIEFNVPAAELDNALSRMKTVDDLAFKNGKLILKGGRLRASIDTVDETPPGLPEQAADLPVAFPPELCQALKLALPFTGDVGWAQGIRLVGNRVTAAANVRAIDITVPAMDVKIPVLITRETAEFLFNNEPPQQMMTDRNNITCTWPDGRWLRAQFLSGEFGGGIDRLFATIGNETPIVIDDTWREALEDGAALADGTVRIDANGINGVKGAGTVDHEFQTGLTKPTYWATSALSPVFACATAWNPEAYPNPALFTGPSLRGVLIGIRK